MNPSYGTFRRRSPVRHGHLRFPADLRPAQPGGRLSGGPLQPPADDPLLSRRLVRGHMVDRPCGRLHFPAHCARSHGHQRGILHPRRPSPDYGLPPRQHALHRYGPAHERHLCRHGRRRLRCHHGFMDGMAHDIRPVRPHRRGVRRHPHPVPERSGQGPGGYGPGKKTVRTGGKNGAAQCGQ